MFTDLLKPHVQLGSFLLRVGLSIIFLSHGYLKLAQNNGAGWSDDLPEATQLAVAWEETVSGVAEITPDLADALYTATDGDIELNQRDGVVFVEFERKATTLRKAVTEAIREVEAADVGVRVVRVESEAANVIAKINADLLGA